MYLPTAIPLFLLPLAAALTSTLPQYILSNPPSHSASSFHIPTIHESAVQARRILNLSSIATLSTVFPTTSSRENRPETLSGVPIGLTDYFASCGPSPYNPTILAVSIATWVKNAAAGSNVTLSLRYHPPADHPPSDDIYLYSPANLPRFSLIGHLERIEEREVESWNVSGCFAERHPDARAWFPGNDIHESWWGRLVVDEVYWFGGFGDRAYIGWIPVEEWRGVTAREVEECRLVGEKGFKREEDEWKNERGYIIGF